MKGRKPLPTHLKILNGNPGKRPLNDKEPVLLRESEGAPAYLGEHGRAEFVRLSAMLERIGMQSATWEPALATYCNIYEQYLAALELYNKAGGVPVIKTSNGNLIQHPLLGVINRHRDDMRKWLVEFGMTPSSSTRVECDRNLDNDPAAEFIA